MVTKKMRCPRCGVVRKFERINVTVKERPAGFTPANPIYRWRCLKCGILSSVGLERGV